MILSLPLVGYTLKAARRDRLIWIVAITFVLSICMSFFLSSAVITEKDMFASVFIAGSLRLFAVVGLVLFISFYIRRLFDNREIEFLLSRPISRTSFVLSIALALSIVAVFFAGFAIIAVLASGSANISSAFYIWSASFAVELLIITNAALFFSMVISSASGSALCTMGFYVFARMMGQLLGISETDATLPGADFLNLIFSFISMFIPRLDLLTQTSWLVYGVNNVQESLIAIGHGLACIPVLLLAAIFDLIRREF
jgi:ABC-type transport system involved in multi-copper enzyme maturation permease subunit